MLMRSTGVVRPILSKSMVVNLRHQSIINLNERLKQSIGDNMTRSSSSWNSNISRLFLELMGYELKNTN
jgi:hypothetical protein